MRRVSSRRERIYGAVVGAPFGRLGVRLRDGCLSGIDFLDRRTPMAAPKTDAARAVCKQLQTYLVDSHHRFRVPLALSGTPFQRRVWRALRRIAAGDVRSYGQLARQLASSPRAVGLACRANPIPVVVPCHRVVAQAGLGGFMGRRGGAALRLKRWLLAHERAR